MKRSLMLFAVLGWAFMAPVSAQWHKVVVPPALYGRPDFSGINFVNQDIGWVVGFARQMYKSTDSGRSWEVQPYPPTDPTHFYGAYFDTPQEGWVFGSGFYYPGPGTIIHTTDGGTTWVEQVNPHPNNTLFAGTRVGNEVWLVGYDNHDLNSQAVLLRSPDQGTTWESVDMSQFKGILNIHVISQDNVWLTGADGTLVQTTDSGRTFIDRSIPASDVDFRKVYFGPTEGYATGDPAIPGVYISKFYATTDNGVTWNLRYTWGPEMEVFGMAVLNNVIYVAGGDFTATENNIPYDVGRILASTDGGFTWTEVARDTAHFSTLRTDIVQTDAEHAWVAGQNVFYYQPNASPEVQVIPDTLVQAGSSVSIQVQASDVEGDTLTYHLLQAPQGLAIDTLSGVISGRPQASGQVGVQVLDGIFGNSAETSFQLHVNFPPQFGGNKNDTLDVASDSSQVLTFTWGDLNPADTLDVAGDLPSGMFIRPHSQHQIGIITAELELNVPAGVYPVSLWATDGKGGADTFSFFVRATPVNSVKELPDVIPTAYQLYQNYPNPFNPVTNIRFQVPRGGRVMLTVYNVIGEQVAVLADESLSPGTYEADFNAANLPSGMYVYVMRAGDYSAMKKMLLVK